MTTATWESRVAQPTAQQDLTAAAVDGLVYVFGPTNRVYNPQADTWAAIAAGYARYDAGAAAINGLAYVVGGFDQSSGAALNVLRVYDPATNTWTSKASMPNTLGGIGVAAVGGLLYVTGGHLNPYPNAVVAAYDPATNTWTSKASMSTARYAHAAAEANGKLYVFGGVTSNTGSVTATVEAYDPATNTWTSKASMPSARYACRAVTLGGKIYIIGGGSTAFNSTDAQTTVYEYDPTANTWTTITAMATARRGHAAAAAPTGTSIIVSGGLNSSGSTTASTEAAIFNTPPNAPTLSTLTGGEVIDRANVNRAAHAFSDPDAGDSQSKFDHRFRPVGGATWTEATEVTPNQYVDYPAGTFAAGDYERQVRTYDSQGVAGPWSPSGFFTAGTAPATPTITDPVQNQTIAADRYDVTWSAPDQTAYQLQVLDGGVVEYDTGTVVTTQRTAYGVPFPDNDTARSIRVRVRYGGLWSAWYTIAVAVSYTPPPVPTVTLQAFGSALVVQVANPVPGVGEPTVAQNDVFVTEDGVEQRRAVVAPNGSWTYWLPRSGLDYDQLVRVEAIGDNGTRSSS